MVNIIDNVDASKYLVNSLNLWLGKKGCHEYAELYKKHGEYYGVNWAWAIFQSCLETGFWQFGGDVKREQNNFAGLGASGNGARGSSFASPSQGIEAHMQNLALRAGVKIPRDEIICPYTKKWYEIISNRNTTTFEQLAGTYASDERYFEKISAVNDNYLQHFHEHGESGFPYEIVTGAKFNATDAGHVVVTMFAGNKPLSNVYVKYVDEFSNVFKIFNNIDRKIELMLADSCTEIIPDVPTWPEFTIDSLPPIGHKVWRVLLSPGHAKSSPGAHGRGPRSTRPEEYDHNVLQANRIKKVLENTGKFIADIYDIDPDNLTQVGRRAAGYHVFVDLHHNAANADGNDEGSEVFYPTGNAMSLDLATHMSQQISKAIGSKNRGAKAANFTTIATAIKLCPVCVLTESYFIDDYSDRSVTQSRSEKAAIAIAESIIDRIK